MTCMRRWRDGSSECGPDVEIEERRLKINDGN